jgi:putative flippase GtrA
MRQASTPPMQAVPLWRVLGKHQIGAVISTAVDFATMICMVELLHLGPVVATAIGATCGGVTNFLFGRRWIFQARSAAALPQAARYAFVSAASAGWNALGEYLLHDLAKAEYVLARCIVAVVVSVAWNFPMQRHFVFQKPVSG